MGIIIDNHSTIEQPAVINCNGPNTWGNDNMKSVSSSSNQDEEKWEAKQKLLRITKIEEMNHEFIELNADILDWEQVCDSVPVDIFTKDFCTKFHEQISWPYLSCRRSLKESQIEDMIENFDLGSYAMSARQYSEKFIRNHITELDLNRTLQYSSVSEEFLREFNDRIDFVDLPKFQKFSVQFIRDFEKRLSWYVLSCHYPMDEEFLEEFKDKIDWKIAIEYKIFSDKIFFKYQNLIIENLTKYHKNKFSSQQPVAYQA